jgi:hypothetical protein
LRPASVRLDLRAENASDEPSDDGQGGHQRGKDLVVVLEVLPQRFHVHILPPCRPAALTIAAPRHPLFAVC